MAQIRAAAFKSFLIGEEMKDLVSIELSIPNIDSAFEKIANKLENSKHDIEEIRIVDTYIRYNIKDNTQSYYYIFEVRK